MSESTDNSEESLLDTKGKRKLDQLEEEDGEKASDSGSKKPTFNSDEVRSESKWWWRSFSFSGLLQWCFAFLDSRSNPPTRHNEIKRGSFLFKTRVTIDSTFEIPYLQASEYFSPVTLEIPYVQASEYFPPVPPVHPHVQIQVSDSKNVSWEMTLTYSHMTNRPLVLTNGWIDFLEYHNLEQGDMICFCLPSRRLGQNHYLIDYVRRQEEDVDLYDHDEISEAVSMELGYGDENHLLFKMKLTKADITSGSLSIPQYRKEHFEILPEIHDLGNVHFIDGGNKDWPIKLVFHYLSDAFTVTDGWMEFVNNHHLNDMDTIKFYEAVPPSDSHFFIECVKCSDRTIQYLHQLGLMNFG